jgi:hypothetical protein
MNIIITVQYEHRETHEKREIYRRVVENVLELGKRTVVHVVQTDKYCFHDEHHDATEGQICPLGYDISCDDCKHATDPNDMWHTYMGLD